MHREEKFTFEVNSAFLIHIRRLPKIADNYHCTEECHNNSRWNGFHFELSVSCTCVIWVTNELKLLTFRSYFESFIYSSILSNTYELLICALTHLFDLQSCHAIVFESISTRKTIDIKLKNIDNNRKTYAKPMGLSRGNCCDRLKDCESLYVC